MKIVPYLIAVVIFLFFNFTIGYDIYSSAGLAIFTYWISRLLVFSVKYLPIKELFFSLYSLQYLFSPAFMYNGLGNYTNYKMKVPVDLYFSYAIPLLIFFSLGFTVFFDSSKLRIDRRKIDIWLIANPSIPYYLIVTGFIAPLFYFVLPASFNFIVYVSESLKFIGLFIILSSSSKPKIGLLIIVFLGLFISSFAGGMFHDLLTWLIMLGLVLNYRYRPSISLKILGVFGFLIFTMFIQLIKDSLRESLWEQGANVSIDVLKAASNEAEESKGSFFSLEALGPTVNRINQGWVLASSLDNVPQNIEHSNGLLIKEYLITAIMPRFLFPEKMSGGDTKYFNMYSGHDAGAGTVMVLGIPTEAHVEFEGYGAFIYIFIFGVLYGWFLSVFANKSEDFPILAVFTILVFIYPMRPDCDTQTGLGHLFKTSILLFLIFNFFKSKLSISYIGRLHAF
jgi:hypothetical protein